MVGLGRGAREALSSGEGYTGVALGEAPMLGVVGPEGVPVPVGVMVGVSVLDWLRS